VRKAGAKSACNLGTVLLSTKQADRRIDGKENKFRAIRSSGADGLRSWICRFRNYLDVLAIAWLEDG